MKYLRLKDLGRWYSGGTPPKDQPEYWTGELPWLSAKDIDSTRLRPPTTFITREAAERHSKVVPPGALLLIVRGMALAHGLPVVKTDQVSAFNQDLRALVCGPDVDPGFVYYSLIGHRWLLDRHIDRAAHGTARVVDSLYSERLPIPSLAEQKAVVRFLDRECAAIAELLALRAEQRTLLEEELASYASDHLTGQDDSWVPLKAVAGFREGPGIMAVDFREEGVPLLRVRNLVDGTVSLAGSGHLDPAMVDEKWDHFRVKAGELLVSGSATSGIPVLVPPEAEGAIPYTGLIRMWPSDDRLDRDYLRCFLASSLFSMQIDQLKTGVAIQHWGPNHLRQVKIPLPPIDEQKARSEAVLMRVERQRDVSREIESAACALREYRDALITEAVTGQVSVTEDLDRRGQDLEATADGDSRSEALA